MTAAIERERMRDTSDRLKTERLSRGWTLQDVSDRTRINITVLSALESGKTEKLGSSSAVETLLKKYSDALRAPTEQIEDRGQKTTRRGPARSGKILRHVMTGLLWLAVFAAVFWGRAFWQIQDTEHLSPKHDVRPVTPTETTPSTTPERETSSGSEESSLQHRELPEIKNPAPEPSPPEVTNNSVSTSEQDMTAKREPEGNRVIPDQPPAPVPPAHSLEIVTDQRTWIQVVVDGKNADTELLQAGESRKWQAMEKVNLVVGNGGGVHIRWDGKPIEISSKPGRVIRLTFPQS